VANGTDALSLALMGMGVGPGDDVVVPSFTFYASVEAIADLGARPVFCDVDPDTACVTPQAVSAALTEINDDLHKGITLSGAKWSGSCPPGR